MIAFSACWLVLLVLSELVSGSAPHFPAPHFNFVGDDHWSEEMQWQCDQPKNFYYKDPDLFCVTSLQLNFEVIKIEIISREPPLLVYRGMATPHHINAFLSDVEKKKLKQQTVLEKSGSVASTSRVANGSWIEHRAMPGVAEMFDRVTTVIPSINFDQGESWSVLFYLPGGHYAPHYDYLSYNDPSEYDWWQTNKGNRMVTFLLVLKTADLGEGTVFPKIDTTVIPEPGDAMLWFNMDTDGQIENQSLHGACVIKEGQKIAATLWVRQKDQQALVEAAGHRLHPIQPFIDPHYESICAI